MYINKSYLSEIVNKLKNNELDIIDYINNICNLIEANEQQIQALLPEKNRRQRLLNDAKKLQEFYPNTKVT
jgi:bifunctional N-acetylglucosamine-1-phosphate-uridyltransferase/glucosamine-1-phosphate-acetyltransferase GlmU-like protein